MSDKGKLVNIYRVKMKKKKRTSVGEKEKRAIDKKVRE